jgi:hypothetical protein
MNFGIAWPLEDWKKGCSKISSIVNRLAGSRTNIALIMLLA